MFASPLDAEASGAFAGFIVMTFVLINLRTWAKMSNTERFVAFLIGVGLAAYAIYGRPEEYLRPHVVENPLVDETFQSYVQEGALLWLILAVSAVLMFLPRIRALAAGFWLCMAILLAVTLVVTIPAGGF